MGLDFDTLYSEASAEAMASGKRRFYDNKVYGIKTETENGKRAVSAVVSGDRDYPVKIIFDEQGGLYDYSCGCSSFSVTDGPCRHIVATALSYEAKFPSDEPASRASGKTPTSPAALNLISQYVKRKHVRRQAQSAEKVTLTPVLHIDAEGRPFLRFTLGRGRQYLVKDVADFVSCLSTSAYKRYGVELDFTHVPDAFDEKSRALCSLVASSMRDRAESEQTYRDELRLSGADLDDFFDLYCGQTVKFGEPTGGLRLFMPHQNELGAKLKVEKASGGFLMSLDFPRFRALGGKHYRYILTDSRLFRLTEQYFNALIPCFKAFDSFGRMFVADGDMAVFYNNVLNEIIDLTDIESAVDLSVFEAAPFVAKIYLDVLPGGIGARLECSYDESAVDILDDGQITDMVRDYVSEDALKALLRKYFPQFPLLELYEEADIYALMSEGLRELMGYAEMYIAEEIKRMKVKRPPRIRVGVRLSSGLLDVELEADGYSNEQLISILSAYRAKNSYIRLADGSFVDLADQSIAALSEILEVAQQDSDRLRLPKFYAPYLDNELKSGFFALERSADFKKLIQDMSGARDSAAEVPDALKDIMRNYQKTGFRWLKTLSEFGFGGILADDMGLGKSLQIIALLMSEKARRISEGAAHAVSIIVCPTTLILNWAGEFAKFAPDMKVLSVMGSYNERRLLAAEIDSHDVIITSYELIRRDDDMYRDYRFEYAVIDEAQYIKNPDTKNARAVKMLVASHRFALTGTPVENSLAELWSIFDFIMPGYLYSYPRFRERFENEIVRGNETVVQRLKKLVQPFIMRRLKSGVLKELPPKIESSVLSALEGEQAQLYRANLALIKDSVAAAGKSVNKVVVLSMLTKLRQICCEPRLVYPEYGGNSAKLDMCMQLTLSAVESGHKVLIFSQFTSMLDIIRGQLAQNGVTHYVLKGDTPKSERLKLVNRFNTDSTQVFLISLKAGGTGLNLTGADMVIHYDPWWNESVMNQATDRAYRIGQDKSVQVYKLILEDTIEQKILKLQEKKTALSGLIVSGAGTPGYDDLMKLLE